MNIHSSLKDLNRVGNVLANRLKALGLETISDLLFYFPFRYEDYRKVVALDMVQPGEQITIKGKIEHLASRRSPRKRKIITEAIVVDEKDRMRVVWFGQPFLSKVLKVGDIVFLSGKVTQDGFGLHMVSPSYEKVSDAQEKETAHTARIVPLYPLTAGVTEKQMRFLVSQSIPFIQHVEEWLPEDIQKKAGVIGLQSALQNLHFPNNFDEVKQAEQRLKFDEFFLLQLRAEMIRQEIKRFRAHEIPFHQELIKQFVDALPFELTPDQKKAAWEILQDVQKSYPMNRLLEGDVGSGKTVVAALAMYNVVLSGYQSILLSPTEILAVQHFETLEKVFQPFGVKIALVTRTKALVNYSVENATKESLSKKPTRVLVARRGEKQKVLNSLKSGEVQIVVGTHALLSEQVGFHKVGFVVVDEQHRFGVEQRKSIREKSENKKYTPHFLSMTATPIPRTFALTLYGDLDLSMIHTKPQGRKPIQTRVVEPHHRQKAYEFIHAQVKQGRQVFVICPVIAPNTDETKPKQSLSVNTEKKSVLEEYEKLSKHIFPDLRVGFLHGKLVEKNQVMQEFANKNIDILVATSVVEVGVNIPNATVMMIESAENFGLAQLHQFRGRVGRSDHQSYCFLFTDSISESVKERLSFFEKTLDGFALAEYDLQTRGPGEVYGKTQSGLMNMRIGTMRDTDIIKKSRDMARDIDFEQYPQLKVKVQEWETRVHLE